MVNYQKNQRVGEKPRFTKKGCGFCLKNGEIEDFVESHKLRDQNGKLSCPVLQRYLCPICGKRGHTKNFCLLKRQSKTVYAAPLSAGTVEHSRREALGMVDQNLDQAHSPEEPKEARTSPISPNARPKSAPSLGCMMHRHSLESTIPTLKNSSGAQADSRIEIKSLEDNEPRFSWNQLMCAFWVGRVSLGHSLLLTADYERRFGDQVFIEAEFRLATSMIENLNLGELGFNELVPTQRDPSGQRED